VKIVWKVATYVYKISRLFFLAQNFFFLMSWLFFFLAQNFFIQNNTENQNGFLWHKTPTGCNFFDSKNKKIGNVFSRPRWYFSRRGYKSFNFTLIRRKLTSYQLENIQIFFFFAVFIKFLLLFSFFKIVKFHIFIQLVVCVGGCAVSLFDNSSCKLNFFLLFLNCMNFYFMLKHSPINFFR